MPTELSKVYYVNTPARLKCKFLKVQTSDKYTTKESRAVYGPSPPRASIRSRQISVSASAYVSLRGGLNFKASVQYIVGFFSSPEPWQLVSDLQMVQKSSGQKVKPRL